jgi:hypothetical protein
MMYRAKTLAAVSLAAVLAGGTAIAQATTEGGGEMPATDQTTGTETAQDTVTGEQSTGGSMTGTETGAETAEEGGATGEMPEAATPEGTGLSDLADVETPEGSVGARQGDQQGRTVMLDIEGFTETIYERGFRQGYIRGIADARDRFAMEMQRIHDSERMMDRMQGGDGAQMPMRPQGRMGDETMPQPQGPAPQARQGMQDREGRPDRQEGRRDRGTIIVLPPGMSPEAFVDQLMRSNEDAMSDG